MKKIIGLLAGIMLLAVSAAAHATFLWSWHEQGDGIDASGLLETVSNTGTSSVLSITGTRNGQAISGLVPLTPHDPNFPYDNQFTAAYPNLSYAGLLYDVAGVGHVNLFLDFNGVMKDVTGSLTSGYVYTPVTFYATLQHELPPAHVPEPGTIALLFSGLGLLGFMRIRK